MLPVFAVEVRRIEGFQFRMPQVCEIVPKADELY